MSDDKKKSKQALNLQNQINKNKKIAYSFYHASSPTYD